MTQKEQEHIKQKGYKEAMRYIANAKNYLQKSTIDESGYADKKYVRTACGTAYNGVLEALSTYLQLKNPDVLENKERKTIDFYRKHLAKENKKMLKELNHIYTILHIMGYYEGIGAPNVIKDGFRRAQEIIDLIKPAGVAQ
jgi:protoporphyrinogen oxidase